MVKREKLNFIQLHQEVEELRRKKKIVEKFTNCPTQNITPYELKVMQDEEDLQFFADLRFFRNFVDEECLKYDRNNPIEKRREQGGKILFDCDSVNLSVSPVFNNKKQKYEKVFMLNNKHHFDYVFKSCYLKAELSIFFTMCDSITQIEESGECFYPEYVPRTGKLKVLKHTAESDIYAFLDPLTSRHSAMEADVFIQFSKNEDLIRDMIEKELNDG